MKDKTAITLKNLSKKYTMHHAKPTLAERVLNGGGEEFYALRNINIKIQKGEVVGFIGPNGSGKTTLLKIIAGISTPTKGKVSVNGRVISLIDLEAGFHPDLTGMQNIFLNGNLLGMENSEIEERSEEIIGFAGIGKFIETPLYTYSEGMKLRLGFSVAVHANPDILILDENLTVGDQEFKKKSYEKMMEMFSSEKTVVIASHELYFVEKVCSRIYALEKGKVVDKGVTSKVLKRYVSS